VALEVNRSLQRLVGERLASMRAGENLLRNEFRGEVTAILLNSELALRERSLSPGVVQKLEAIHDLAAKMRCRLEAGPARQTGSRVRPAITQAAASARTH